MSEKSFNSLLEADMKRQEMKAEKEKKLINKKNKKREKNETKRNRNDGLFDSEIFLNLRKKVRRNFFMGFGFGLMIASVAFWIFSGTDEGKNANNLEGKYTDSKIIEKAKELGMVFEKDIKVGSEDVNND